MIKAAVLHALVSAGATPQMLVAAIEADRADALANRKARNARYYKTHSDVLRHDKTSEPSPSPCPPVPPSQTLPPITPQSSPPSLEASPLVGADASTGDTVVVSIDRKPNPERAQTIRALGEWWNDLASSLAFPQIERIEGNREVTVLQRAKRLREDHGTLDDGLRFLEAKIRGSPFLQGKTGWRAFTFDWCLKSANFQKIVEGNYDREVRQEVRR